MRTLIRIFFHPQLSLVHYTTHHGPYLAHHSVHLKYHIRSRYFDNQFLDTINGHGTDGQTKTHKGGK